MSVTGEFPPGTVFTSDGDGTLFIGAQLTKQKDLVKGESFAVSVQWAARDPSNVASFELQYRIDYLQKGGTLKKNFNFEQTSDSQSFKSPAGPNEGFTVHVVVFRKGDKVASVIDIPMNALAPDVDGGGELVFGDLDASVNVVNVTTTGATVEGTITNKTQKTGDIAVYIEIRDQAGVSVVNNAPLNNQFMPAGGTLFSNLIYGQLLPGTSYEARVFALDSTHTVPLSPIAVENFTTLSEGPGPGPGPGPDVLDAQAFGEPLAGPSPLTVQFSSQVTGGVPSYVYSWVEVISGEELSQSASFAHTFENIGEHIALLTVTDSQGNTDTAEVRVLVDNALPPPPPPGPSGFALIALPLFMGGIAYVWPDEENRKKAKNKMRALARATIRGSRRELDKATRALIRGVNRR